jgi:4-hydroxythreonine-4-phosphate dehydrogenase
MSSSLPLLVTPGDPRGIGPEVVGKALNHWQKPVVVIGSAEALKPHISSAPRELAVLPQIPAPGELREGVISVVDPGDDGEPVEVLSLRLAVMACMSGRARGLVTGPIHKARLASRGFRYPGHTEFLASLCGIERPVMAFVGGRVRVSLVTVHLPVRAISDALTTDLVLHTLQATNKAARERLGLPSPRIAVCGLNPHAGDEGLLGNEDTTVVAPAVRAAVREGIDARGPISAEAAFRLAVRDEVDWVVAMYHDQGLVPLKALECMRALEWSKDRVVGEDRSVNWTLGLPVLRVGVDHGTADDIVGQGVADEGSMVAALALADRLTS